MPPPESRFGLDFALCRNVLFEPRPIRFRGHVLSLGADIEVMVISAGRHVIEVHEGEVVALREEIVLEPGETKTLQVKGAPPE